MLSATVLIDNDAKAGLESEWGLSIALQFGEKRVLLDVGASGKFLKNANSLGIDISSVDFAVLSHAHSDHAGGMEQFFAANSKAKFFVQSNAAENCWGKMWIFRKYIGIPQGILAKFSNRIVRCPQSVFEIDEGIFVLPHEKFFRNEGLANRLFVREGNSFLPDEFRHEQSLVFDLGKNGLVIFTSCSHVGADVIVRETSDAFGGKKIRALVGGFHLFRKNDDEIRLFAQRLKALGIEKIFTCHCTGKHAYKILHEEFGDKMDLLCAGARLSFGQ